VSVVEGLLERTGPVDFILDYDDRPVHQEDPRLGTLNDLLPLGTPVSGEEEGILFVVLAGLAYVARTHYQPNGSFLLG